MPIILQEIDINCQAFSFPGDYKPIVAAKQLYYVGSPNQNSKNGLNGLHKLHTIKASSFVIHYLGNPGSNNFGPGH
jgi:hypothetical protein